MNFRFENILQNRLKVEKGFRLASRRQSEYKIYDNVYLTVKGVRNSADEVAKK